MRSANPALNNNTFRNTGRFSGTQAMTIDGTVNKTALGLLLLMTSAIYSWNNPRNNDCNYRSCICIYWKCTRCDS